MHGRVHCAGDPVVHVLTLVIKINISSTAPSWRLAIRVPDDFYAKFWVVSLSSPSTSSGSTGFTM